MHLSECFSHFKNWVVCFLIAESLLTFWNTFPIASQTPHSPVSPASLWVHLLYLLYPLSIPSVFSSLFVFLQYLVYCLGFCDGCAIQYPVTSQLTPVQTSPLGLGAPYPTGGYWCASLSCLEFISVDLLPRFALFCVPCLNEWLHHLAKADSSFLPITTASQYRISEMQSPSVTSGAALA